MNKVILIGRLTAKPELKYTQNGKAIATFSVACNRMKKQDGTQETDFINCRVWEKQAENLVKYQDKGNLILVDGSLRHEKYIDENENKKNVTYVMAKNIEYLESKNKNNNSPSNGMNAYNNTQLEINVDNFLE